MKIKATVLTTNEDLHGCKFSEGALKKLAAEAIGKPIVAFGHQMGNVSDAYIEDGNLVVEANPVYNFFVVPSFCGIGNSRIQEFSITSTPADPSLPAIKLEIDPDGAFSRHLE